MSISQERSCSSHSLSSPPFKKEFSLSRKQKELAEIRWWQNYRISKGFGDFQKRIYGLFLDFWPHLPKISWLQDYWIFLGLFRFLRGSHDLSAWREWISLNIKVWYLSLLAVGQDPSASVKLKIDFFVDNHMNSFLLVISNFRFYW